MKVLIELEESELHDLVAALKIAREAFARFHGRVEGAKMYHIYSKVLEKLEKQKVAMKGDKIE